MPASSPGLHIADRLGQHWVSAYSGTALSKSTARAAVTIRDLLGYLSKLPAPPQDLRYLDETALDGWVDDIRRHLAAAPRHGLGPRPCESCSTILMGGSCTTASLTAGTCAGGHSSSVSVRPFLT